jgi:hypothetical protein
MKATLLFLIKFVLLTAPFVWFWQVDGLRMYHAVLSPVADAIYGWLGFEGVATPARDRYINMIPFVALMVLTPNLSIRRRLGGIAIGLLILCLTHIAVNLTANPHTLRLPRRFSLILDAAPFFLWVIIANEFVRDFMRRTTGGVIEEKSTESGGD